MSFNLGMALYGFLAATALGAAISAGWGFARPWFRKGERITLHWRDLGTLAAYAVASGVVWGVAWR